jgi:hypothetical protein
MPGFAAFAVFGVDESALFAGLLVSPDVGDGLATFGAASSVAAGLLFWV